MKVSLLSIGRVQLTGTWDGLYGQFFIAWAPLIKRDKAIEAILAQHDFKLPITDPCFSEILLALERQNTANPNPAPVCTVDQPASAGCVTSHSQTMSVWKKPPTALDDARSTDVE